MNIFAPRTCAYALMVLNTALAGAVLTIEPSKWIVIPIGALLLPCCYLVIRLAYRHTDCASACMTEIYEHLAMGAFMITSALAITLTNVTGITPGDMGPRVTGAMLGMLIVFLGIDSPSNRFRNLAQPIARSLPNVSTAAPGTSWCLRGSSWLRHGSSSRKTSRNPCSSSLGS